MRGCQKLLPCQTEPMSAGSKTDPLLAKAQHINDGGSATGIMYLRRRRKISGQLHLGGVKIREKNSPADPIMSEEGRDISVAGTEIPLQPMGKAVLRQLPSCILYSGSTEKCDLQNPCKVIEINTVSSSSCTT